MSIKTPADLKAGQIIELRWEYFDHDQAEFEPRFLKMILLERIVNPHESDITARPTGWKAKVIYDSNVEKSGNYRLAVPYDNMYYDTWVQMSINQNKLRVIS